MNIIKIALIACFFFLTACPKKSTEPIKLENDKILADLKIDLLDLEKDQQKIQEHAEHITSKLQGFSANPKIAGFLRNGLFKDQRYLEQIKQQINYLRIRIASREAYLVDNQHRLDQAAADKEYADYSTGKLANPNTYLWRKEPLLDLGPPETKASEAKSEEEAKKSAH